MQLRQKGKLYISLKIRKICFIKIGQKICSMLQLSLYYQLFLKYVYDSQLYVKSCVGDFGSNIVISVLKIFCGLGNIDKQQRLCDVFSDTSFRPYFEAGASPRIKSVPCAPRIISKMYFITVPCRITQLFLTFPFMKYIAIFNIS